MSFKFHTGAALCAALGFSALSALPALAEGIMFHDAYAITARPGAPSGAAFMAIMNATDHDDRLLGVASAIAKKVELHTHIADPSGVMKMTRIDGGIALPAGATHLMQRGGDHVMFMGLNGPLEQGADVVVTFTFEKAGDVEVTIPVDLERKAEHASGDH